MSRLALPGILSASQLRRTAEYVASQQLPSGLIPWFAGRHGDPWDHVEGAMALAVAGMRAEALRAYEWSAHTQSAAGTWPMETVGSGPCPEITNHTVDTNQCAYIAVGIWQYWLLTGDGRFVDRMWPVVRRAVDFVCDMQQPGGGIAWSLRPDGEVDDDLLLTGSASMVLSLRCALALADLVGDAHPDWELAAGRLAHAVAVHPDAFVDKARWSMDWYYPVLGGAVRGADALALLNSRWDEFVVPGRGIRCVSDRPWVTAAETCELVIALDAIGDTARAARLMNDIQFCRDDADGGYWTGWVFPEAGFWPAEKSTWTASAVVLAADALAKHTPAHGIFRGAELPQLWSMIDCDEHCYARV